MEFYRFKINGKYFGTFWFQDGLEETKVFELITEYFEGDHDDEYGNQFDLWCKKEKNILCDGLVIDDVYYETKDHDKLDENYRTFVLPGEAGMFQVKFDEEGVVYDHFDEYGNHIHAYGYDSYTDIPQLCTDNEDGSDLDSDFAAWIKETGQPPMTRNQHAFAKAIFNLPEMELIGLFDNIYKSIRQWKRNK